MSKEEYVQLTIKVPKRLIQVLEDENYFGWNKEDFFVAAIKDGISCELSELDIDEVRRIHKKYGEDVDTKAVRIVKLIA